MLHIYCSNRKKILIFDLSTSPENSDFAAQKKASNETFRSIPQLFVIRNRENSFFFFLLYTELLIHRVELVLTGAWPRNKRITPSLLSHIIDPSSQVHPPVFFFFINERNNNSYSVLRLYTTMNRQLHSRSFWYFSSCTLQRIASRLILHENKATNAHFIRCLVFGYVFQ